MHSIESLSVKGIRVRVLVADGHRTNVATLKQLGCDFDKGQYSFIHNDKPIHCMLDIVHMMKVLRNLLEEWEEVMGPHGTARWCDVKNLVKLQVKTTTKLVITGFQ